MIFLFVYQTSSFQDFMKNNQTRTNVDSIINSCNSYVEGSQSYTYCCETKIVKRGGGEEEMTCDELKNADFVAGLVKNLDCSAISC